MLLSVALSYSMRAELFALIRDSGAAVCLLAAAWTSVPRADFWPRREHIGDFLLLGLCGIWGGQLLGGRSTLLQPPQVELG